ncbi:MAG: hypothetical protein LBK75_00600 [Oscillospiraceae bacterium]|nr:hypothetical protein [Oscillospiraceae bacterium]
MKKEQAERPLAVAQGRLGAERNGVERLCRIELWPREVRVVSLDTEEMLHRIPTVRVIELTKHRLADVRSTWQAERRPPTAALAPSLRPWENSDNPMFSGLGALYIGNQQPAYLKLQYRDETGRPIVLFFSQPEFGGIVKKFLRCQKAFG